MDELLGKALDALEAKKLVARPAESDDSGAALLAVLQDSPYPEIDLARAAVCRCGCAPLCSDGLASRYEYLSDARNPRPDAKVADFFRTHRTFAEIRFGIELLADHSRRGMLTDWLTVKFCPMFDGRVLPLTEDTLLKMALVDGAGPKDRPYPLPD